jgi:hypothetical protein
MLPLGTVGENPLPANKRNHRAEGATPIKDGPFLVCRFGVYRAIGEQQYAC